MEFLLTTDTSCDVFKKDLDAAEIPWVPLTYTLKGETFDDNFSCDDEYRAFYQNILAGAMPTTSQINSFAHEEFFTELLEKYNGKPIVHLSLSGGLSNTVNSARVAAREVMEKQPGKKVYVVDTLSATQGHHLLLKEALRLRDAGKSAKHVFDALNSAAPKIQHWFMVDDLHHLKRGGRVSGASAAIGTLLNIKPVLNINNEGKLSVVKKLRGVKKVIEYFIEVIAAHKDELKNGEIILVSGNADDYATELKNRIAETYPECPVSIGWVGPIIGAHTGNGIFGLTFLGKKRES